MPGRDDEDRDAFAEAMRGVKPLPDGPHRAPDARGPRPRAPDPEARGPRHALQVLASGERLEGLARGVDRAHLRRLAAGEPRPGRRVDLHGLEATGARLALRAALAGAWSDAERCVLVVHGRGRHSEAEPILKASLADWLAEPPWVDRVMAWHSAQPRDGGPGATYVLLRRNRS